MTHHLEFLHLNSIMDSIEEDFRVFVAHLPEAACVVSHACHPSPTLISGSPSAAKEWPTSAAAYAYAASCFRGGKNECQF